MDIRQIMNWQAKTFDKATFEGQIKKFQEESLEMIKEKIGSSKFIEEMADVFIVSYSMLTTAKEPKDILEAMEYVGIARYMVEKYHIDMKKLWEAVEAKMVINQRRVWEYKDGRYQHISGKITDSKVIENIIEDVIKLLKDQL